MERRTFIGVISGGLLAVPLAAEAQGAVRVPRIGFLGTFIPSDFAPYVDAFRQGLRGLGYVEGSNIAIDYRWAEGHYDRLPDLAMELVRLKVDVILTHGTLGPLAAKQATTTIPIVIAGVREPIASGLVAGPRGNVTGLAVTSALETSRRQLELLKDAVPKVSRVAILWTQGNPSPEPVLKEIEVAARRLGLTLQPLEVRGPNDHEEAFSSMRRERAGALIVLFNPLAYRVQIVKLAAKYRLPAIYELREFADAGGLMSFGPSLAALWRRAATYVDKMLKGAKPADLPVEQPTKFELVINLKTAKALGLTIPPSVLLRADQIIE